MCGSDLQAKEDFTTMLEESDELPEGTRWGSKVARIFDLDPRWKVLAQQRQATCVSWPPPAVTASAPPHRLLGLSAWPCSL